MHDFFSWFGIMIDKLMSKFYPIQDFTTTPILPPDTPTTAYTPPTAPQTPKTVNTPPSDHLTIFCTAIMNFEGGPGDPNHINNNPGDFRCSPVGYLPKYGKVGCTPHGFAVFPTFALGWEYLLESVHYRAHAHPNWTFLDFFNNYAPASDSNPTLKYAQTVAKTCGVAVDSRLSDYLA